MARAARNTLVIAAALLAAACVALLIVFRTAPGRATVKPFIERALGEALGGTASIGTLAGALPAEIVLTELRVSGPEGDFLVVESAELVWNPLALLRRRIDIDHARIEGGVLLKAPPERAREEKRPRGFELPERLPFVRIGRLSIADFRIAEAIAGSPLTADVEGAVNMGGRTLDVTIEASSSGDRDIVSLRIERRGDSLATNASIQGAGDGALASVVRLGGPVRLEAKGEGPLADYRLAFTSAIGAYGDFGGALSGDLERMERIGVDAAARFGPRLSGLARIVGPEASLKGAFLPQRDGGALEVGQFRSALGAIEGTARWRNREAALATVEFDAYALFEKEWRPDIQRWIGDRASVRGEISPDGKSYRAGLHLRAPLLDADAEDIATDLDEFAKGLAALHFSANAALPRGLEDGADVDGDFDLRFDEGAAAEALTLTTADGGVFRGSASYQFRSKAFEIDGEASLPPAQLARFNGRFAATSNAAAVINVGGTTKSFAGEIVATTPLLKLGERPLPAARITLTFEGAPTAPTGTISARAKDGRRLDARFARKDGFWRASGVDYRGRDFALKGSAAFNPESKEGAADLLYRGGANAEPFPGVKLAGAMVAKGSLSENAAENRFSVRADSVASGRIAIAGFSATAIGPMDDLAVEANAEEIAFGDFSPISGAAARMTARLGGETAVTVRAFDAELGGAPFALAAPARIVFADGVAVDGLRARLGQKGALALDGSFTKTRWRARLVAKEAPIVGAASIVDLTLDLDTDKEAPADGAFALTSLLTRTEQAQLSGFFRWDGRTLNLRDDGESEALDLDLRLPLSLVRAPAISVTMEGAVNGAVRYAGRAETVAAFLPSPLQSIEGAISLRGTVRGTLADPKLAGELQIRDGAYTELATGLGIVGVDGTATASGALNGSRVEFRATAKGPGQTDKTITASGAVRFGEGARVAATLRLEDARLAAGPVTAATLDGVVEFSGPFSDLKAKGDITVKSLDADVITPEETGLVAINVVRLDAAGRPPATSAEKTRLPTALSFDIAVTGDDRLFVRGRGLTSEWRAEARIIGRADAPVVLGTMTLRDGEIVFAGRRFAMTDGAIAFDRLSPNNPALDLRAERETGSGVLAAIRIEGRARTPKITLESTPALPQEDIMALLLFDKPASELSALESLQVAESLAELSGIGPFGGRGLTGSARAALGLDILNFDFDEADSSASSLTIGKYVADGLFVSATQDARGQNGSVRIEYEINDDFTVETELRQDGDQTASVNWKHDF